MEGDGKGHATCWAPKGWRQGGDGDAGKGYAPPLLPPPPSPVLTPLPTNAGGLTDNQYKFLKQVYNKFETPIPPAASDRPRTPNLSFKRDMQRAQLNARIEGDRKNLLGEKKMLLGRLANTLDQQSALMNSNMWSGRTPTPSVAGSARSYAAPSTARSNYSVASSNVSMASFRGTQRARESANRMKATQRPKFVPQLF